MSGSPAALARRASLGASFLLLGITLAGCASEPQGPEQVAVAAALSKAQVVHDLDAEQAQACRAKLPVLALIYEAGKSDADESAYSVLHDKSLRPDLANVLVTQLDVGVSRTRATVTRFHAIETPVLLCLSSRGIIVSRDEKTITRERLLERVRNVEKVGPELDAQLETLEKAAAANPSDFEARLKLADFWSAHTNAREAIPHLEAVSRAEPADVALRTRAWVEEVRAHFWIAEAEKARHTAAEMIQTLGPRSPDARAAGKFVLGEYEVKGRHKELGLRELDEAIAAAPDSLYGKQAAELKAKLAKGSP